MKRTRAFRKQQELVAKTRAKRLLKRQGIPTWSAAEVAHWIGLRASTPCVCSCSMCRNPRHSFYNRGLAALTVQEQRDYWETESQLLDLVS